MSTRERSPTDLAIDELKFEMGVRTDRELAERLAIDPTAVAAWRRRNKIPLKYQVRADRIKDEFGFDGKGDPTLDRLLDAYAFAAISIVVRTLDEKVRLLRDDDVRDMWYGFTLSDFYAFARAYISEGGRDKDRLRIRFAQLKTEIARDDIYVWLKSLPAPQGR
ncbi:MAG: hypothetical protein Q8S29_06750 [Phreatobacter sp.]|nr:hypothetical protein [Phreatobacter sp.]